MAKVDRSILQANDQNMGDFGDPNKLEASISHLADKIDGNDNETQTLKTDNTSNKGRLDTLEGDVSILKTDNTINKSKIASLEGDNANNKNRVTTLETDNASNKSRISTNENNIAYNEGRLINLLRDTQKASEVVDARDGFPVLLDKLESIDTKVYLPSTFKQAGDIDDTASINRALAHVNTLGGGKVRIPFRAQPYIISSSLIIYSNTHLEVDTYATIQLANDVNTRMVENANKSTQSNLTRIDKNIKITGGIWDGNGTAQTKKWEGADGTSSLVTGFLFSGIDRFVFKPTKVINTKVYGVLICNVNDLLIENVEVYVGDTTDPNNRDGIHILGPAENVVIQNCKLHSEDNVIAINADDVPHGPYGTLGNIDKVRISNITVNNHDGGQGMLILSATHSVTNVTVENIKGQAAYLMNLSTFDLGPGNYDNISIRNTELQWLTEEQMFEAYIMVNGKYKNVSLENIFVPNGGGPKANGNVIKVQNTASVATSLEKLKIQNIDISSVEALANETFTILNVLPSVVINHLQVDGLISKNNVAGCSPLIISQSSVKKVVASNFDVDNTPNGHLYLYNATIEDIYVSNMLVNNNVSNQINYTNIDKPNIKAVVISNSGNLDITTSNKIDKLYLDGRLIATYTPVAFGLNTPSTYPTFNLQLGEYTKQGKVINFQAHVSWSGYTGNGQMSVSIPQAASAKNIDYIPVTVVPNGFTVSGKIVGLIFRDGSRVQFYIENNGSVTAFNIPTTGELYLSGAYNA